MSLYYHDSLDFTAVYNERLLCPGTDSSVMRLFLTDVCNVSLQAKMSCLLVVMHYLLSRQSWNNGNPHGQHIAPCD